MTDKSAPRCRRPARLAVSRASGNRVLLVQGLRADAAGQVSNTLDFWKIQGCDSRESFGYTIIADAPSAGPYAQAEIELTTKLVGVFPGRVA